MVDISVLWQRKGSFTKNVVREGTLSWWKIHMTSQRSGNLLITMFWNLNIFYQIYLIVSLLIFHSSIIFWRDDKWLFLPVQSLFHAWITSFNMLDGQVFNQLYCLPLAWNYLKHTKTCSTHCSCTINLI